jgi:hypothetical protein
MKIVVRSLVAIIVLSGAAASTQTSSASSKGNVNKVTFVRTSLLPVPTCAPSDPNACGLK